MSNPEHDAFGSPIGGTRWFNTEPTIEREPLIPMHASWRCPISDCGGEMKFNGMTWPTGNPGYHHTCDKCEFTAAVRGKKYPCIEYLERGTAP